MRQYSKHILSLLILAFALLTLFLSSSVIFDLFGIRAKEGNYVPFVVWANFISSLLYIIAAYGIWRSQKWSFIPLLVSTLILAGTILGLHNHIDAGGLYETRTVGAMYFRTTLTLVLAILTYFIIHKGKVKPSAFYFILVALSTTLLAFRPVESNHSLTIIVNDLKSNEGVVQYTLYNQDGTIPDEHYNNYYKQETNSISENNSSITFHDLPQGYYAVNILHDEDEDGVIKKGWILPIEGIGFSNLKSINPLNRPSFNKTKFELTEDNTIQVKIIYL